MPDDEGALGGRLEAVQFRQNMIRGLPISRTGEWKRRIRVGYDGARYDLPALKCTQSSFMQPQMMVQDRYFYDPVAGKYTVDRYLDDLEKRYGGIDAVLIWPTYPNMGIDNRNQHDMIRSMPGGVPGVRQMIADFHRRGVRVLFPMMMWDQGTRDAGMPWPDAIASLMAEVGADSINGDTQDGVSLAFSLAAAKIGHPLAFEPKGGLSDEALAWNVMTWASTNFLSLLSWTNISGLKRGTWSTSRTVGTATKPTIYSSLVSKGLAGKVGRTSGASGME
jgi:hypothetical protein